ncbi:MULTISPECIES: DUF6193 family natural product biosynthesis protein [unclassified Streptomyces]|uniref:DUF6193 family natural product biosynthesis protein n=1 Tax=unclassified Streptomyces TaxID=2593676 RepID=UPI0029AD7D07|nr:MULTISPECIES: DUF6193 family natural product biosynthesis protein [unclassified Streptomyces]MDX3771552.1 DUF6193 family natural product biosynthesis protein [Streptomyces sp. AK08-01B]MDX3821368.1 DUF6193 family natural product biosynthesis protein [Streptomyces sp. AK08-01A]
MSVDFADAPDAKFYPELVEHGGLYRALRYIAEVRGLDVGEVRPGSDRGLGLYRTAVMQSNRGIIRISTVLNRRAFSISLDSAAGDFVWASGSTGILDDVAEVVGAWRHGILLAPLRERYPFIKFSQMAQGYEQGAPVETAWDILLGNDEYVSHREMLTALHSNPRLRGLFPFFSHETLRLSMDCFNREAGEICIDLQDDGLYSVRSSLDGMVLADISMLALTDAVASLLHE